jgi:hypothetical protein
MRSSAERKEEREERRGRSIGRMRRRMRNLILKEGSGGPFLRWGYLESKERLCSRQGKEIGKPSNVNHTDL